MKQKEASAIQVDPTSFTAATQWCILDQGQICAGGDVLGGVHVLFRKADADTDSKKTFDDEVARRYPNVKIADAPRSYTELAQLRSRVLSDEVYWNAQGLRVDGGTVTLDPRAGTVVVGDVPATEMSSVDKLFAARYGKNTVRSGTAGPL